MTDLLAGISRRRPVLLVIEDGHWADAPTLLLLRHLARAAGSARMLLLGTFRDTEAELPETLSETLADLRRSDDVVRLRLAGLSGEDVTEFVRRAGGGDVGAGGPELAQAIERPHRRQRVPRLRAVARARRDRGRRGRRRRDPARPGR